MAEVVVNTITGDVIEGYDPKDLSLIPSFDVISQFTPSTDVVEFSIYNEQGILEFINNNYTQYQVTLNYNSTDSSVSTVTVDPEKDLIRNGYEQGNYTVYYNFLRNQVSSSTSTPFFVTQISSDRTEIRVINNSLSNEELQQGVDNFVSELNDSPYFEDFRVNFGNNNIFIANNVLLDTSNSNEYTLLIKLYEPLPTQIELKDSLTIALQTADEVSYAVNFENRVIPSTPPPSIGGPNFSLNIADKANIDTTYKNASELLNTTLSSSYDQILSILNEKGIKINLDYSDFNNFVFFSSAEQRVRNFYYKVGLIESYDNEIATLDALSASSTSSSIAILEKKKQEVIKNFDGYEYYQYFSSGSSNIYPKTNTTPTYTLAGTGSVAALAWLEDQAVTSGSVYDLESVDRLANSLPLYVQDDTRNAPFILFMDMVGQHFDIIWAYTKDISNRFDGDNRLAYGISKDLVKDALISLGVNVYGNNQSSYDLFTALTDVNPTGGTGIPTGSEVIETTVNIASPEPQEDLVKGVYKRIFHNLPYLIKKKGSVEGLRALINSFGVPESILRISEFGGYSGSADLWKNTREVENQAFSGCYFNSQLTGNTQFGGSTPRGILFRIKWNPTGSLDRDNFEVPGNSDIATFGTTMNLEYTGDGNLSGSYSGSIPSSSLDFYRGTLTMGNSEVTAPFFNGEWWTIYIDSGVQLKAASKIYNGNDGFTDPIFIEGTVGSGLVTGNVSRLFGTAFGSGINQLLFQELRFYKQTLTDQQVKDFTMNPNWMWDGDDAYDKLFFRAPLGADGNTDLLLSTNYQSVHPKVSGYPSNFVTESFASNSNYTFTTPGSLSFVANDEFVYLKEPVVGIKNRVSQKIRNNTPNLAGTTLSNLDSIEQKGLNTELPTPDVDYTEVAFSPQNEINDDIAATYGDGFDLGSYIDPGVFEPSSNQRNNNQYSSLNKEMESYFQKYSSSYSSYNWNDYIRLIKYFDSSLFKMIKDFTPAKSNVTTGVVIKQHLLERNKSRVVSGSIINSTYSGSVGTIGNFEGGGGGVFNAVNGLEYYWNSASFDHLGNLITGSKPYPPTPYTPTSFVSQSWQETILTKSGSLKVTRDTQQEFYNGELGGSDVTVTNGEISPILVTETYIPDAEFVAAYNTVRNRYNLPPPGGDGAFSYSVNSGATEITTFTFDGNSSNGVSRDSYLSSLVPGDTIQIRVRVGSSAYNYQFTISSLGGIYAGAYTFFIVPTPVVGQFYLDRTNFNTVLSWDVDLIWDPQTGQVEANSDSISPTYGNTNDIRLSTTFMDVDYSFGSGSLVPVNLNQIIANTAQRAPVQDSNYTSTGLTNGRYNGTKISSLGFNIPYLKQ